MSGEIKVPPGVLAKPVMRGMNASFTKKYLAFVVISSSAIGLAMWQRIAVARKKRYAEFYKNYDADKEFRKMVRLGVFTAIKANGELNEDCEHFYEAHKDNWKNPLKDEQGNPIVDSAKFFKD